MWSLFVAFPVSFQQAKLMGKLAGGYMWWGCDFSLNDHGWFVNDCNQDWKNCCCYRGGQIIFPLMSTSLSNGIASPKVGSQSEDYLQLKACISAILFLHLQVKTPSENLPLVDQGWWITWISFSPNGRTGINHTFWFMIHLGNNLGWQMMIKIEHMHIQYIQEDQLNHIVYIAMLLQP